MLTGYELKSRCAEIEKIAIAAREECLEPLRKIAARSETYTFKERVKDANSIHAKVMRKRNEAPTRRHKDAKYEPDHMTDAWACRYVTLFQTDIVPLVAKLLRLIRHEEVDGVRSPFVKNGLVEAVIYTNRPDNDPLAITKQIGHLLQDWSVVVRPPENKKSGYSSVHLIVQVPVRYRPFESREEQEETAKIEIQLRDIFEEGWGEIQHRLIYSGKDDGPDGRSGDGQAWWRSHLNALKAFADGCSQHASIIKQNSLTLPPRRREADTRPVTPPELDREIVVDALAGASRKVLRSVEYAYRTLLDLQDSEAKPSTVDYVDLANAFKDALEESHSLLARPTRNGRSVGYHLKMEYAVALQNSQDSGVSEDVISIFKEIESQFQGDATVYYRHSRAITRIAKEYDDWMLALDLLMKAEMALISDQTVDANSSFRLAIPIQIGYVHWAIFHLLRKELDASDRRRQHLEIAITETGKARSLAEKLIAENGPSNYLDRYSYAAANLLYYYYEKELLLRPEGVEAIRIAGPSWDRKEIDALLKVLQNPPVAEQAMRDLNTRDTLMCIYYILGDARQVDRLASRNIEELMDLIRLRAQRRDLNPLDLETYWRRPAEKEIYEKALDMGTWARQNQANTNA